MLKKFRRTMMNILRNETAQMLWLAIEYTVVGYAVGKSVWNK